MSEFLALWKLFGESLRWLATDFGRFLGHIFGSHDVTDLAFGGQPQDGIYFLVLTLGILMIGTLGFALLEPMFRVYDTAFDATIGVTGWFGTFVQNIAVRIPILGARLARQREYAVLLASVFLANEEMHRRRLDAWRGWARRQPANRQDPSDWLGPLESGGLLGGGFEGLLAAAAEHPNELLKEFRRFRVPIRPSPELAYRDAFGSESLLANRRLQISFLKRWYESLSPHRRHRRVRANLIAELHRLMDRETALLGPPTDLREENFWHVEIDLTAQWLNHLTTRSGKQKLRVT